MSKKEKDPRDRVKRNSIVQVYKVNMNFNEMLCLVEGIHDWGITVSAPIMKHDYTEVVHFKARLLWGEFDVVGKYTPPQKPTPY